MALNKAITNERGITANYHRLFDAKVEKHSYFNGYRIHAIVKSYVNQDIRNQDDYLDAFTNSIHLTATIEEMESTPLFTLAYNKLKDDPKFEGAEDC